MAATDEYNQVDPERVLDASYWRLFGLPDEPSVRDKLLAVTIDDIGRVGPTTFNAGLVCQVLGVAPSLINHHFGGRDELIAEATLACYRNYVSLVWQAVEAAPGEPRDRLRAWIESQFYWSSRMSGWGPILNYPSSSLSITAVIDARHRDAMTRLAELNMARLIVLVGDVKRGRVSQADFTEDRIPKLKLMRDLGVVSLAASIGWSVLGMSVWRAGRHLPTGGIRDLAFLEKQLTKAHIDRLIDQIG